MEMYNYAVHYGLCCYCSLVIFREVFFVTTGHRKPENLSAKSCKSMISVHRGACCWSRSEQ